MTSVFSPSWRGAPQARQACSCRPCNRTDSRASSRSGWRAGNRLARRTLFGGAPVGTGSVGASIALPTDCSTLKHQGCDLSSLYSTALMSAFAPKPRGSRCIFRIRQTAVDALPRIQSTRLRDPACGSGGMFVQCAKFVERHHESASRKLSVFGTEKTEDTVPLAKMNLALHGLSGDIRQANSYYEDPHHAVGAFDYVMANPPFNVDKIKKEQLAGDRRFPFGLPKADNGNYLWIQQFYAALAPKGRAGFVMANSASDAGNSEKEIRKQIIQTGTVDVMIAISPNFFYTVTLPVTLWFFDKAKISTPLLC